MSGLTSGLNLGDPGLSSGSTGAPGEHGSMSGSMNDVGDRRTSSGILLREYSLSYQDMNDTQRIIRLVDIMLVARDEKDEAQDTLAEVRLQLRHIEQQLQKRCDTQRILKIAAAAGLGAAIGGLSAPAVGLYAGWLESAVSCVVASAVGGAVGGLSGAGVGAIWDEMDTATMESENTAFLKAHRREYEQRSNRFW